MTSVRSAPALELRSSAHTRVWRFFCRRFLATYHTGYPWNGEGRIFPAGTEGYARRASLPGAVTNGELLDRVLELANGDATDACLRIDLLFQHAAHVRAGIDLRRVVGWWEHLGSERSLAAHTLAVMGRRAS